MPVFYIHQTDGSCQLVDDEGADYDSLDAAIDDAVAGARALLADRVRKGLTPDGWRFEIADSQGALCAVIPLAETISEDGSVESSRQTWYRCSAGRCRKGPPELKPSVAPPARPDSRRHDGGS